MNIAQIENNLQELIKNFTKESFIYDLLLAYGQPKATIQRIKVGGLNLSKIDGEIAWKKKLFFKTAQGIDLHQLFAEITGDNNSLKHDPRFVVLTDFLNLLALDTKTQDTLDIPILEIAKHFDFFLPWAGMEKAQHQNENPADVRAAEKMAKLYDDIKKDNPTETAAEVHNLNVFLSRLLFCFFAEDTGILEKGQFTIGVSSHTQQDGSDLNTYLDKLFEVMNTEPSKRENLPQYLTDFPYVNGGLFRNKHTAPLFTRKSRQSVIDSGELDWSAINPDIFGSMIQAVITPEHRGGLGMHYTSVPNIMKLIEPLFLNELYEEFEASKGNKKRLNALLNRIWNIKIFDPACGSGNFLIIAYKELRKLEIAIIKEYDKTKSGNSGFSEFQLSLLPKTQLRLGSEETSILQFDSRIKLSQFYGIELDDFAHEIAILSLWLAEHQMNQVFFKEFGRSKPALPLKETGNIVHGNATRLDWEKVCPKMKDDEIYVLGNPPYLGSRNQNNEQKDDLKLVLGKIPNYKKLDYIACWFYKLKLFIDYGIQGSFVSTNSICQGEQVEILWPLILNHTKIEFAVQSFKWTNNAKNIAGVTVVIIGLGHLNSKKQLRIINNSTILIAENISPYLTNSKNIFIQKRNTSLSLLPEMTYGNYTGGCNELLLTEEEKNSLINHDKRIIKFIRPLKGADEILKGINRFCIWIYDENLKDALEIDEISEKIKKVKTVRLNSKDENLNKLAYKSHQFRDMREATERMIVIPIVSSERRKYLPCGFVTNDVIVPNSAQVIFDPEIFIFSLLISKIHFVWIKAVCGSLESRIRYSSVLGYNTFPFPKISDTQKQELEKHVYNVLAEREAHSEKTLAQLYDPDKMPDGLREAHHQLDLAVEKCYRAKPFETDEERLEYLFKLYEQMIAEEKSNGTLFETGAKIKKKK